MADSFIKQSIKQASIIIAVFTILSQVLGLAREMIIASYFGTSAELDMLLVALAIPLMFSSILFMAIPSASIPFLQDVGYGKSTRGKIINTSYFKVTTLLILAISVAVFITLPLSRNILAKNLSGYQIDSVIGYGRLFCLIIPFKAYEAVFRSLLHIRRNFIFPALTNLGFNVMIIAVIVALFPSLASRAFVLAWLMGTFAQVILVAIPSYFIYKRDEISPSSLKFNAAGYTRFLGVIILIESMGLIIAPFDRYIGSIYLQAGYVSAINYADIVNLFPLRIFIFSITTAIFPILSEKAAGKNLLEFSRTYHKSIAICIMIILPISVFALIFKHEIIGLLFERGNFVVRSREITVEILQYYLFGLLFSAFFYIQSRTFYALKLWRPLSIVKFSGLILKCFLGILLIKSNWALAIGGGTIAMYAFCFFLLEYYLIFKTNLRYSDQDMRLLFKAAVNGLAAVGLFVVIQLLFGDLFSASRILFMFISGIACFSGLIIMDMKLNVTGIQYKMLLARTRISDFFTDSKR